MKTKMTLANCVGCIDNFYNGNNPYGVSRCWSFDTAKLDKYLLIHVDQPPPYALEDTSQLPTCFKKKGYCKIKPESLDSQGYWRMYET